MRVWYALLARSLSIAIVPGLVFASGAACAGGRITLRNETGAVVRIEAVDPASDAREFATVLEIDEIEEWPFASATLHLFLTSYVDGTVFNQVTTVDTAAPDGWIWRDETGGPTFRIVPHLFDRYLLESGVAAAPWAARGPLPTRPDTLGTYRDVVQATGFTPFETIKAASVYPHGPDMWLTRFEAPNGLSARCPAGHRLHYQGFCINVADEHRNDGAAPVRSVPPLLRPVSLPADGAEPRP